MRRRRPGRTRGALANTLDISGTRPDAFQVSRKVIVTGSQGLDPVSIRELVIHFLRAVERVRAQDGRSTHKEFVEEGFRREPLARGALFEALNWADSIDNYLRKGLRNTKGTARDLGWAEALPLDQRDLVLGLQHARNVSHHRWFNVLAVTFQRGQAGEQVGVWTWGVLPPETGSRRRRDKEARSAYLSALKGEPLLDTLDRMAAVFWTKRGWHITRSDVYQVGYSVASPITFDGP